MEVNYSRFACYIMNRFYPEAEESQLTLLNKLEEEGRIRIVDEGTIKINSPFLTKCFEEKIDFGGHNYSVD